MSAQLKKEKYSDICLSANPFTLFDLVYINKPNVDINENNASSELHATRPFCSRHVLSEVFKRKEAQ